jgi:ppGpp synthetase/RelA/SpoT-type nucleotidyltranferase
MKIDTDSIIKEYEANSQIYKNLAKSVHYELSKKVKLIKTHSISYRIKELSSLLDKVRRKDIEKPFEQIHDLVGFRIVCLFLSDLEEIKKMICKDFDVFEKDDKVNDMELNIFGYMSLHLKARLKSSFESPFGEDIKKIPFEIQVRTIAQDAWGTINKFIRKSIGIISAQPHAVLGLVLYCRSAPAGKLGVMFKE